MDHFICTTCGTQYEASEEPPAHCMICEEYRQFVLPTGLSWTTLASLRISHKATFHDEQGLLGIGMAPDFGIGQRALLVRSPDGNVLWDCISLIDDAMVEIIEALGGLKAIAISHPHYYTTMTEWSRAFGDIPVYLHKADSQWIQRSAPCLQLWAGETREIAPGLTLIRTGGHFEGGTVLHWAQGAQGKGAILSADLLQVTPDRKFLSFMRSYPNYLPLGEKAVRAVAASVAPYRYDAIYGAFWDRVISKDAKAVMDASVLRHIEWLNRDAL
jgi:glyoxylase-like metal-dependent hydrolase (beta-lactamase superfamily II)